ncbi:MAG TPA: malto-oligosyltrehalose synthase [Mycobacterium sp.]|nr:malto-oligosyltrehalose synthase [Mycobacterium sp.]
MGKQSDVLATYRLQLRGPDSGASFTFEDAEGILDYLAALGVSHLYLSPILTAAAGSSHGYDVTDPTTVSAGLGGPDGLARLSAAARARGLGIVVDIVPNHLGVELAQHNPWWWDVLRLGRESAYYSFFDIDWDLDPDGRIVLPVLGSDDDIDHLVVDGEVFRLGDKEFPLAPDTATGTPREIHDRQHYRLTGWREGVCGYRRFFSVTSLAGLRQEDPEVFAASHREVARWFSEGLVDGVRVDHPDGLADPAGYLRRLRELIGPDAYLVVEKILAPDEALDDTLPVNGTTGYDALREIGGLFVDPAGRETLCRLAGSAGFAATPAAGRELKAATTADTLASELARVCRVVATAAGADHPALPEAVTALLTNIEVYRCDYPGLSAVMPTAIADTAAERPDLAAPLALVAVALDHREPAVRIQQLCGAVTAKAIEDRLFYRDPTLVSLNEVGGDPHRFGVSAAEFHHRAAVRAARWPTAMTTLSTHDTKRGEDVRARIGVLSQVPGLWAQLVADWSAVAPPPDPDTGLFLWQNLFGVWPATGRVDDTLRDRLHGYAEKAIREAHLHTSWTDPDDDYEKAVHTWLDAVLDGPVAAGLTELVHQLDPHAQSDALGQKLLSLTVPGVPDVYQGTELWEDNLVDPDNRRPVDFPSCRAALDGLRHPKMRVVHAALALRRARPQTFLAGGYTPSLAAGDSAEHLVAFRRGDDVLVAVTRWTVALSETGWGDTTLAIPPGSWRDRLTGAVHSGTVAAAALFGELPVVLLERCDA